MLPPVGDTSVGHLIERLQVGTRRWGRSEGGLRLRASEVDSLSGLPKWCIAVENGQHRSSFVGLFCPLIPRSACVPTSADLPVIPERLAWQWYLLCQHPHPTLGRHGDFSA